MTHQLRAVNLDFLSSAPQRWEFRAPVAARQSEVFAAISADPSTWTWFPGLTSGGYDGPAPHGVGSRRHVSMEGTVYRETMLAWDEPRRWAYRVDESSTEMFDALAEDWVVEDRADNSIVRWTFAIDPKPEIASVLESAPSIIGKVFDTAMANLSERLSSQSRVAPPPS